MNKDANKQSGTSPTQHRDYLGLLSSTRDNHLRHCPKHRKPLPCAHCALAAKPAQVTVMGPPEPAQSKSAIRAAKWRAKQKQVNPQFGQQEAERKSEERAEIDRVQEVEDTVRANPDPAFVMKDAPRGKGELVTGGYDSGQIELVNAAHERAETGHRVTPKDWGTTDVGKNIDKIPAKDLPKESESTFAPTFKKSKEVRILYRFVSELTSYSNARDRYSPVTCLLCKQQLTANVDERIAAGYRHFQVEHPGHFQMLLDRLNGKGCKEDHDGMVRRHGGGSIPVQCKRCRKLLYKPPKKSLGVRSDRPAVVAA